MKSIKCFDIASMVIEEVTENKGGSFRIDSGKLDSFKLCCRIIDELVERFNGVSCNIVVEKTMDITITLVCHEFEINKSSDRFYMITERAKKLGFKKYKDEEVQISFTLDGIWEPSSK